MDSQLLVTPSRKTSEHHGMADRKPVCCQPITNIDGLKRRLFNNENENLENYMPRERLPIRTMRF